MSLLELAPFLGDKLILYKLADSRYIDIFKGFSSQIPQDILLMKVGVIGSRKKGLLDIEVRES